jgi:putative sterol carrier protein
MADDAEWNEKAKKLSSTMHYVYGPPLDRAIRLVFDEGRVAEVEAIEVDDPRPADVALSASGETWRAISDHELKPTLAMATGKMKIKGKQTVLLKNMAAFGRLAELQEQIGARFE